LRWYNRRARRGLRERLARYGDVDVTVNWGEVIAYDMSANRKAIARDAEKSVRRMTAVALRAAPRVRTMPAPPLKQPQPLPEPARLA
jgi:1-acyl-sn-glycerol-3-phosphate acyltransferase